MPDPIAPPADDGQITTERFNGLMSAHQKALAENRDLKAQMAQYGQAPSPDPQQPPEPEAPPVGAVWNGSDWESPGEPPTPRATNPARSYARTPVRDDGSVEFAQRQLDVALRDIGLDPGPRPPKGWLDGLG